MLEALERRHAELLKEIKGIKAARKAYIAVLRGIRVARRNRRKMSAAARKKMSEAAKKRWAERKKT